MDFTVSITEMPKFDSRGCLLSGHSPSRFVFHEGQMYRLCVGGKIFLTMMRSLSNDGTRCIFDKIITFKDDGQGIEFIIDCDPVMFRHIHNFYRTGKTLLPDQFGEHMLLIEEAKTFGMNDMVQRVQEAMNQRWHEKIMKMR